MMLQYCVADTFHFDATLKVYAEKDKAIVYHSKLLEGAFKPTMWLETLDNKGKIIKIEKLRVF